MRKTTWWWIQHGVLGIALQYLVELRSELWLPPIVRLELPVSVGAG